MSDTESQSKLVYVVEDDEEQLVLLRLLLADAGHQVVTETSADRVLAGVKDLQPDVVLLDVMLPSTEGLDGFALCQQIRNTPAIAKTPIIIVSAIASGTTAELDKIRVQVGADGYILKPYNPTHLLETIRTVLG